MLVVDNVRKVYSSRSHDVVAVVGADLRIEQGECVALVGESGSGKSTLAKLIVGLTAPTSGRVEVQGQDVRELSASARGRRHLSSRVQMVFQNPYSSIDPTMTIEEIVREPLTIQGWTRRKSSQRVKEVLDLVDLGTRFASRRPRELSGGQRQRVGIARALSVSPSLLVLDEPVASLDVSIQGQILQLLQTIRRETQVGILIIAHDLGVVRAVSDRTIVMYLGQTVERAPTSDLFDRPLHPYTASLLASATSEGRRTMPDDVREGLGREALPHAERQHGCVFRNRCAYAVPECADAVRHVEVGDGHDAWCNVPLEVEGGR
ncbi:ABC transporter ATP-binding protein [Microbacterium ulmi]|uniref:ATP-binding cassette domain-containing protein n=1 Tax=Microbacterium ulmi TaxID=179095 RepID=A0A7Y2M425_9MICO|nr:oligopeptide/dipeptide ABC transporter ATP-binding protein [Microbacterium ulmi]NII69093.1 oligopeptide/dipeptide ABC transporter ATP-binding protein [Microbacterium ulmi]NNH04713.1 ATP-binding cassette domain-containing protein [Microbacterium ulmi]